MEEKKFFFPVLLTPSFVRSPLPLSLSLSLNFQAFIRALTAFSDFPLLLLPRTRWRRRQRRRLSNRTTGRARANLCGSRTKRSLPTRGFRRHQAVILAKEAYCDVDASTLSGLYFSTKSVLVVYSLLSLGLWATTFVYPLACAVSCCSALPSKGPRFLSGLSEVRGPTTTTSTA